MQIIKGNKTEKITKNELDTLSRSYNSVIVDLGTGDGRFIYKLAIDNPNNFYIGIDPSAKQLEIYSKEANKKRLENIIFSVGSIEIIPEEIFGIADYLYINLPWGSLLENIVNPTKEGINTLAKILKNEGILEITLGYHDEAEPGETERLNLPPLDEDLVKETIYPAFGAFANLELEKYKQLKKSDLKGFDTSWAKKLSFGSDRPLYRLVFKKG